jgi:hypothetical protein
MTQVEREDLEEKMVAEDLRSGYLYRDKVLRPSLVSVSVRSRKNDKKLRSEEECKEADSEAAEVPDDMRIDIHENIEEDQ